MSQVITGARVKFFCDELVIGFARYGSYNGDTVVVNGHGVRVLKDKDLKDTTTLFLLNPKTLDELIEFKVEKYSVQNEIFLLSGTSTKSVIFSGRKVERKEEMIFDLIRELINSAKQSDLVRYRAARKELKRLKLEDPEARRFINYALKGLPK